MTVAYIDESGNLADSNPFFIVAAVSVDDERLPKRIIKRVRRVLGRSKEKDKEELKFSKSSERIRNYFVKRLEESQLYCIVFVIDKNKKEVHDTPENYGLILSWVLETGFSLFGWHKVFIDRKYSKLHDQTKLEELLQGTGIDITRMNFVDSMRVDGIKLADFVAGFYSGFYNQSKPLPRPLKRISLEERVPWKLIKMQKAVAPRGPDGLE